MNSPIIQANINVTSTPKVGDILCSTWGYDQTNADFYQVTKVGGKMLNMIHLETIEKSTGPMFGSATPGLLPHRRDGNKVLRKMFKAYDNTYRVKVESYANAYPWDGKPVEVSHTH